MCNVVNEPSDWIQNGVYDMKYEAKHAASSSAFLAMRTTSVSSFVAHLKAIYYNTLIIHNFQAWKSCHILAWNRFTEKTPKK